MIFALTALISLVIAGGPDTQPVAPLSYDESVRRVEQRQRSDDSVVAPGGRTLLMSHGARTRRIFVFLHGFTDSPEQFAELGRTLYGRGDNVLIPRLPHHAEKKDALRSLSKVRAGQLEAFGDSVVEEAAGLGDTVIVVGLSAGGAIAGHIAQHRSDVGRVVMISPAIAANYLADDTGERLVRAASRLPEVRRESPADSTGPQYRQGITSRGLGQVLRLGATVRADAARKAPLVPQIVFLLNDGDQTVSKDAAMDVARNWKEKGASVAVYSFSKSRKLPHNVMTDNRHGGNLEMVNSVVDALANGRNVPETVRLERLACGLRCRLGKQSQRFNDNLGDQ